MEQTVAAIKEAAGQARATEGEVRRQWRTVLVDGELSLATIISHGRWKEKHNVVPQWLASAEKIAGQLVAEDGGSRDIYLRIYRDLLFCLVVLDGKGDPSEMADAAIQLGRDLIAEAEDPEYRSYLEWQLGACLVHAAQLEYAHGRFAESLRLANNADALMVDAAKGRRQAQETTFYLGRLHFLIGSVYAVHKRDHVTAVRWYEKSIPNLKKPTATAFSDEQGLVGEKLVSIGVSLWKNGRRESAVSLTEEGADLIQKAVNEGTMTKEALAVPFENLAEMHRALGNTEQAEQMASKAANADKKR
jgi:tetratricopeptide (TPR) repeat protein